MRYRALGYYGAWLQVDIQGLAPETTHYPGEFAEMALAHAFENKDEAIYRRGDLFKKRVALMNDWAGYFASSNASA